MTQLSGVGLFDPRTTTLLKEVLALAELTLPVEQRSVEVRIELATRILKAAANGERDPGRLREAALVAPIAQNTAELTRKGPQTSRPL